MSLDELCSDLSNLKKLDGPAFVVALCKAERKYQGTEEYGLIFKEASLGYEVYSCVHKMSSGKNRSFSTNEMNQIIKALKTRWVKGKEKEPTKLYQQLTENIHLALDSILKRAYLLVEIPYTHLVLYREGKETSLSLAKKIGEGKSGVVYVAHPSNEEGCEGIAIKFWQSKDETDQGRSYREELLAALLKDDPFCVQYYGEVHAIHKGEQIRGMAMEYISESYSLGDAVLGVASRVMPQHTPLTELMAARNWKNWLSSNVQFRTELERESFAWKLILTNTLYLISGEYLATGKPAISIFKEVPGGVVGCPGTTLFPQTRSKTMHNIPGIENLEFVIRDWSPDNTLCREGPYSVLLDDGTYLQIGYAPKRSDWSIGRQAGKSDLTSDGTILGNPQTLAPELIRGEPPTQKSDIYMMGALLLRLVTRCHIYSETDAAKSYYFSDARSVELQLQRYFRNLGTELSHLGQNYYDSFISELYQQKLLTQHQSDFFGKVLRYDPDKRPTSKQLLGYLVSVNKQLQREPPYTKGQN